MPGRRNGSKDAKEGVAEEAPRTTEAEPLRLSATDVRGDLGLSGHPLEDGVWVPGSE